MKGLILGTTKGLDISSIYPWASSAAETGNRVVLLSMERNFNLTLQLKGLGVEVVTREVQPSNRSPHNERFLLQHEYLSKCEEEYAIVTDVRDVIFQKDPIDWMKNNLGSYGLVCSSEGLAYKDEPWGDGNLKEGYPDLYETHKENTIMNVGVIGGKTKHLANVCLEIYNMCKANKAYLSDQSSFNVICAREDMSSLIYRASSKDEFCLNAGTFVRNATGGRFILTDDTVHLLREPEPIIENKTVKNPSGVPYCVLHQWDRIPQGVLV